MEEVYEREVIRIHRTLRALNGSVTLTLTYELLCFENTKRRREIIQIA